MSENEPMADELVRRVASSRKYDHTVVNALCCIILTLADAYAPPQTQDKLRDMVRQIAG